MPTSADIVAIARQFDYVREAGQNSGQRVNGIQYWCAGVGGIGQSWCCYFATMVLDIAFKGKSPIPRLGACQQVYALAAVKGWLTDTPATGDLFLYVNEGDHAHHIGILTRVDGVATYGIAGNTSPDGTSSNGDGVYEHQVWPQKFVAYPRD